MLSVLLQRCSRFALGNGLIWKRIELENIEKILKRGLDFLNAKR